MSPKAKMFFMGFFAIFKLDFTLKRAIEKSKEIELKGDSSDDFTLYDKLAVIGIIINPIIGGLAGYCIQHQMYLISVIPIISCIGILIFLYNYFKANY